MPDGYIIEPGELFEPGDIFAEVPFPNLRHPLRRYRLSPKPEVKGRPEIFHSSDGPHKAGDIIHSTFEYKTVMLLSHGCELDKVLKLGAKAQRRHWSCAPVEPLQQDPQDQHVRSRQQRIRDGVQWNRFYIPENQFTGPGDYCVDLRRISPIPAQYFIEAHKTCSLSQDALYDLYSQMGVNQSGLLIYREPIACPTCGEYIDPRRFLIKSIDDVEEDVD